MKVPHFNIVIVGSGVTGLSTAYHLHQAGTEKIAVLTAPRQTPFSTKSAGIVSGGLSDNFTRITNAHGLSFAQEIWSFANSGFDSVMNFAKEYAIPCHSKRRIRLIVDEHELREAEQAVKELQSVGLEGSLHQPGKFPYLANLAPRVLAVQDEGERGAWLDLTQFTQALRENSSALEIPTSLLSFEKSSRGLVLNLKNGLEISTEFLVLACHTQIAHFLPTLKEALVTYADQWSDVEAPDLPKSEDGIVFSAHHGYEWGILQEKRLHFGGGRYLRKLAGIGAKEASVIPRIVDHMREQLQKTFTWGANTLFSHTTPILDIWPCDELPVIGPMFGEDRILLSTGYMGTGLSLGFQAGRCLAEIILHGNSSQLARRLWPERLRTL